MVHSFCQFLVSTIPKTRLSNQIKQNTSINCHFRVYSFRSKVQPKSIQFSSSEFTKRTNKLPLGMSKCLDPSKFLWYTLCSHGIDTYRCPDPTFFHQFPVQTKNSKIKYLSQPIVRGLNVVDTYSQAFVFIFGVDAFTQTLCFIVSLELVAIACFCLTITFAFGVLFYFHELFVQKLQLSAMLILRFEDL